MCFDHSQDMWEERSCHQTREWQHWGSGCYEYKCEHGRLHIMVRITLKHKTYGKMQHITFLNLGSELYFSMLL